MFTDLPESALHEYRSAQIDPHDFDDFWMQTLKESRAFDLGLTLIPVETGLSTIDTYDVTFAGFRGQPIKAWLRVPMETRSPLPTVVQFVGYGGGRGHVLEDLLWASAGFAHLQMDTRGQGSVQGGGGQTPDPEGSGPQSPGFMTRGIDSRETYYYRHVFVDAVRTVDAALSLDVVDSSRIAVMGGSQGGGIALAVAGLVPEVAALISFVPFLCDFPRATVITDWFPYKEIGTYLAIHRGATKRVHETLAYFDGVNFAKRATAPAWFSAALMDLICPPSTVFGAFNNYAGKKEITVWPYNGHEGGGIFDYAASLAVLQKRFGF
jgi:cephalosporin-C deacetylase